MKNTVLKTVVLIAIFSFVVSGCGSDDTKSTKKQTVDHVLKLADSMDALNLNDQYKNVIKCAFDAVYDDLSNDSIKNIMKTKKLFDENAPTDEQNNPFKLSDEDLKRYNDTTNKCNEILQAGAIEVKGAVVKTLSDVANLTKNYEIAEGLKDYSSVDYTIINDLIKDSAVANEADDVALGGPDLREGAIEGLVTSDKIGLVSLSKDKIVFNTKSTANNTCYFAKVFRGRNIEYGTVKPGKFLVDKIDTGSCKFDREVMTDIKYSESLPN